jgi:hypothetical protein
MVDYMNKYFARTDGQERKAPEFFKEHSFFHPSPLLLGKIS